MAQKPEGERDAFGIARVGKRKWGYDVAQVDAFLERAHSLYEDENAELTPKDIQGVSFDMRRGGYEYKQVDAALDRLERAVVDKQTAWEISSSGRIASKARSESLLEQMADHANRAQGQRFAPGESKTPSYDRKQVDALVDSVIAYASARLRAEDPQAGSAVGVNDADDSDNAEQLDANKVSHAVFTQRKGAKGYDERQVDYYLSACSHLLTRIESFERVSSYDESAAGQPQPARASAFDADGQAVAAHDALHGHEDLHMATGDMEQPTQVIGVAPLFSANPERHMPPSYAPQTEEVDHATSFDALHKEEQAIFSPATNPQASTDKSAATREDGPSTHVQRASAQPEEAEETVATNGGDADQAQSARADAAQPSAVHGMVGHDVGRHGAHVTRVPREREILPESGEADVARQSDDGRATAGTDAEHAFAGHHTARTISDIAPITPAPRSENVDRAMTFGDARRTDSAESSIDALAQLAKISRDEPDEGQTPNGPQVLALPDFSMPHLTSAGVRGSTDSDGAATDAASEGGEGRAHGETDGAGNGDDRNVVFPSVFGDTQDDFSLNIPDLSFPSFDQDEDRHESTHAESDKGADAVENHDDDATGHDSMSR